MANAGTGASPQPRAASGFFVDSKKGEVNELKALLKNINVERDMKRKRDVLKKVIAYMTLGTCVSVYSFVYASASASVSVSSLFFCLCPSR